MVALLPATCYLLPAMRYDAADHAQGKQGESAGFGSSRAGGGSHLEASEIFSRIIHH
nr:hypothetical protein [Armatimonas sp.]